jgi:hypothetical protein
MLFFYGNSDVDQDPNSACPMDMTLLLSGSKNPHLAPTPMTNSAQW